MSVLNVPRSPGDRDVITLITRMRTRNCGNQALSAALLDYFRSVWPQYRVVGLERAPAALDAFVLDKDAGQDLLPRFKRVARDLHELARPRRVRGRAAEPRLEIRKPLLRRIVRRARRHAPALDGWLASAEYRRRLEIYRRSALVIANPAGEFDPAFPGQVPARLLLDIYIAKLCGARTAAINHSVEITDPALQEIIRAVYPELDAVIARDEQSMAALIDLGVSASRISVAPDAVFTLSGHEGRAREFTPPTVAHFGVALNPRNLHVDKDRAALIVRELLDRGHAVTAVSNCWSVDRELWRPLARKLPIGFQPRELPYREYLRYLSQFDGIASGRLHTNIMGMICGVPSIPLEGNLHRTGGLLGGPDCPLPVIHLGSLDWMHEFQHAVTRLETDSESIRRRLSSYVAARGQEMSSIYSAVFGDGRALQREAYRGREQAPRVALPKIR